eukprot:Awhi_evm1s343
MFAVRSIPLARSLISSNIAKNGLTLAKIGSINLQKTNSLNLITTRSMVSQSKIAHQVKETKEERSNASLDNSTAPPTSTPITETPPTTATPQTNEPPKAPAKKGKLRELFAKYGVAFLVWETVVWMGTGTIVYTSFKFSGANAIEVMNYCKMDALFDTSSINPTMGDLGISVAINECLEPLRFPIVLATTPLFANSRVGLAISAKMNGFVDNFKAKIARATAALQKKNEEAKAKAESSKDEKSSDKTSSNKE